MKRRVSFITYFDFGAEICSTHVFIFCYLNRYTKERERETQTQIARLVVGPKLEANGGVHQTRDDSWPAREIIAPLLYNCSQSQSRRLDRMNTRGESQVAPELIRFDSIQFDRAGLQVWTSLPSSNTHSGARERATCAIRLRALAGELK